MSTLTIGMLDKCPTCLRFRREPGAHHCPDCTIMARLSKSHAEEIDALIETLGPNDEVDALYLYPRLRDNADFKSYETADEFVVEWRRWARSNPDLADFSGTRRCPECGHLIDD